MNDCSSTRILSPNLLYNRDTNKAQLLSGTAHVLVIRADTNLKEEVLLFGSRLKDTYRPGSDIDLAIKGTKRNEQTVPTITGHL